MNKMKNILNDKIYKKKERTYLFKEEVSHSSVSPLP
jgi:hypothetical protein